MKKKYYKYSDEAIKIAVTASVSVAGVLRLLGIDRPSGGSHAHISRRILQLGCNTSHFLGKGSNLGPDHKGGCVKQSWDEILVLRTSGCRAKSKRLKRAMIESGKEYVCENCGQNPIWNDKNLTLQIEHRDRNWLDDRKENICFLCPNCHSQTDGWCGRK